MLNLTAHLFNIKDSWIAIDRTGSKGPANPMLTGPDHRANRGKSLSQKIGLEHTRTSYTLPKRFPGALRHGSKGCDTHQYGNISQ